MRIRYRAQALADIDEIGRYLIKRSPSGARNVLRSIRASVRFIAENPLASEKTDFADVRMKVVVEYPYKIFYSVHPDFIEVLHIRHSARRPWEGTQ
ncbi:MAG TPA: type II toxin-antitoxin system RelE/ParE family toxin [Xanthobacteraceae bacterium]|nr:type II toxin-antitoxin system RelE/ParE family toxin [Xanthobacteraceae bacterium]